MSEYYDIAEIAALGCQFNLVFGERSNGKTTAGLLKIIEDYSAGLGTGVYVRQMAEDIKAVRATNVMASLRYGGPDKDINLIAQASGGQFDQVKFYRGAWFLGKTKDEGSEEITWQREPFCYAMAITNVKHDKSSTPPRVRNVVFDEFIPLDGRHIPDETAQFRQLLSTVIRDVDTVQVFMFANSISWNSPYFELFGATKKVRDMEQGDTVVLTMHGGDGVETKAAFEYCKSRGGKKSDVYFGFADETSAMITNGKFQVPEYPPCPHHFTKANIKATYWMQLPVGEIIRCRLMKVGREVFVFADQVTTEMFDVLKDERRDLFYSLEFSSKRNHYVTPLRRQPDSRTDYLVDAFASNRMFFSSSTVGEDLMYFAKTADMKSILSL